MAALSHAMPPSTDVWTGGLVLWRGAPGAPSQTVRAGEHWPHSASRVLSSPGGRSGLCGRVGLGAWTRGSCAVKGCQVTRTTWRPLSSGVLGPGALTRAASEGGNPPPCPRSTGAPVTRDAGMARWQGCTRSWRFPRTEGFCRATPASARMRVTSRSRGAGEQEDTSVLLACGAGKLWGRRCEP